MKTFPSVLLTATLLALAGCGNPGADLFVSQQNRAAKTSGSPFRLKAVDTGGGVTAIRQVMIDLPRGDTRADGVLQKDILSQIRKVELSKKRGAPAVEEVRLLPDGREVWVLANKNDGIAYVVTLRRAPQGGTYFLIHGPEMFTRG